MATITYSRSSPYFLTQFTSSYLGVMIDRPITKLDNDKLYKIDRFYHLRPDLLADDLYKDSTLWWVFAARNKDILKDPLFDFVTGTNIYLPTRQTLVADLQL